MDSSFDYKSNDTGPENTVKPKHKYMNYWNIIMRYSPTAITLSLLFATVSSVGYSQGQDDRISSQATIFMDKASIAEKNGNLDEAINWYETALAVHPRNRKAYIALAQIAERQMLTGKAITLYKEVLEINPNDQNALLGQGRLYAKRGAVERAKSNLTRLEILCGIDCGDNKKLSIAIADAGKKGEILASDISVEPKAGSQN